MTIICCIICDNTEWITGNYFGHLGAVKGLLPNSYKIEFGNEEKNIRSNKS